MGRLRRGGFRRLAYPEVRAALAAAGRANRLTAADQRVAERGWEGYWAAVRIIELTSALSDHAGRLADAHALRGADAVHLASLSAVGVVDTLFAAWDERLRAGAESMGARLAPSSLTT